MKHIFLCVIFLITPDSFANVLPNSEFKNEIGGLIQIDYRWFDQTSNDYFSSHSDISLRRARLNNKGRIGKNFRYKLEVNFDESGDIKVEDAFINFRQDHGDIYIGRMLEPFSMEGVTSPKWNTSIELSPISSAVSLGRSTGALYRKNFKKVMLSLGIFDNGRRDKILLNGGGGKSIALGENNYAYTGRFSYRPYQSESSLLHLGFAYSYRETKDAELEISSGGSALYESPIFMHTSTTASNVEMRGLESVLINSAFSIQAEYLELDVNDHHAVHKLSVDGWYVLASYFITGEKRNYSAKTGDFGAIRPKNMKGAIEGFGRYSKVDYSSESFTQFDSATIGVNYYVNQNIKLSFNAITGMTDNNQSKQAYLFRLQVNY